MPTTSSFPNIIFTTRLAGSSPLRLVGSLAEWYTEMNLMCDTVQNIMDSVRCKSRGQEQNQYYQSY